MLILHMRFIPLLMVIIFTQVCGGQPEPDQVPAEVVDDLNRRLLNEPTREVIFELEDRTKLFYDGLIKQMPDLVRQKIFACETPEGMDDLSPEIQIWLQENVDLTRNLDFAEILNKLHLTILNRGQNLIGGNFGEIFNRAFWRCLHNKPLEFEEEVRNNVIHVMENSTPDVKYSPQGKGEIEWLWKLPVKERLHGVLHVGIDLKKRTFICYERSIGVYFPEGETLERIYREIVQNPDNAGSHIGIGRKVKAELRPIEK